MLETWKIIVILLHLLSSQTLAADKLNVTIDHMVSASIKKSVRPCGDFYFYACGNYDEQTFFDASVENKNLLEYANHQYNTAIIKILETYDSQKHDMGGKSCQALTEKARNYFEACRKLTTRNLTRYLEEMQPGLELRWPILEDESSTSDKWPHGKDFDVLYLLGKLASLRCRNVILQADDFRKTWKKTILIKPFESRYSWTLEDKDELLMMLPLMGIGNAAKIVRDAWRYHQILADISRGVDKWQFEISFAELMKRYPKLNFTTYFMAYLGEKLPSDTSITLDNSGYFQKLNDNMWSLFDKSKLCSYLMLHYLTLFDATTKFNDTFCIHELRKEFHLAVNFIYYQQNRDHFDKLVNPDVREIFRNIVDMLEKQFQSHDLELTSYQTARMMRDLKTIRLNIGNIPENVTCENITELYATLPPMAANNYYKNHMIMLGFDINDYHMSTRDAIMFDHNKNMLMLSYAYLMPPFYDFHYNNLSKYAILGYTLAQQLMERSSYLGIFHREEAPQLIATAIKCMEKESRLGNTLRRIDENVASEVIRKLVTLKFFNLQPVESVVTWKRRFFLNVAQTYCVANDKEVSYYGKKKYYLNAIVMDSDTFAQAFQCREGSEMNPRQKCKLW